MFLDTIILIDFLRGDKKAISTIKKIEHLPIYTSEINIFELIEGAYIADWEVQPHIQKILSLATKMTVLSFDRKSSLKAGMISGTLTKKGQKIGEVDCLIAGIALANGITTIITKNKKHFDKIIEIEVLSY